MAKATLVANGDPLNFIPDIYSCAAEPHRWAAILRETSRRVGGCAAIILRTFGEGLPHVVAQWARNLRYERAMLSTALSIAVLPAIRQGIIETPYTVRASIDIDSPADTQLSKTYLLPKEFSEIAFIPLTRTAGEASLLMILRAGEAGDYLLENLETIEALSPHFRRTAAISSLLDFKPIGEQFSVESFNRAPIGIILTDPAAKILHANAAAENLLDGCALLCLEDELAARDGRSDTALRAAIADAASVGHSSHARRKVTFLLINGPGSRALEVWVMPVAEGFGLPRLTSGVPRVAVVARASDAVIASARVADAIDGHERRSAVERRLVSLIAKERLETPSRPLAMPLTMATAYRADQLKKAAPATPIAPSELVRS